MLKNLKIMLGIAADETELDEKLSLIIANASARLKRLLGGIEPPNTMNDIILEVAINRFNRIGSEGMASHSVEGESYSFNDNDFVQYAEEIQAFLDSQKRNTRGRVRFL